MRGFGFIISLLESQYECFHKQAKVELSSVGDAALTFAPLFGQSSVQVYRKIQKYKCSHKTCEGSCHLWMTHPYPLHHAPVVFAIAPGCMYHLKTIDVHTKSKMYWLQKTNTRKMQNVSRMYHLKTILWTLTSAQTFMGWAHLLIWQRKVFRYLKYLHIAQMYVWSIWSIFSANFAHTSKYICCK